METEKEIIQPEKRATGPFEFFRKYQKMILYTAGLFTLVTFSITGALMGFFDEWFREEINYGTIEVAGKVAPLTQEDYAVARLLRQGKAYPTVVLPHIHAGNESGDNRLELFALLRRIAIETGLEVSTAEVDRAIDQVVQQTTMQSNRVTPTQIALSQNHTSLQAYRIVVAEAMRIGNYMRLEALAADTSDAAMARHMLEQHKKIVLKVAKLDKGSIREAVEETGVSNEELQTWLDELDDLNSFRFRDTNRVSLQLAAVIYAQFDREQFAEELADVEIGEQQMRLIYDRDKELRWRWDEGLTAIRPDLVLLPPPPPPDPYLPFEDEALQTEIRQMAEAEEVLHVFRPKIQAARTEHLQEPQTLRDTAQSARTVADQTTRAAKVNLDQDPTNAELVEKLAQAETELEEKEAAFEEAETGLSDARASFDMGKAFTDLVNERPGFALVEVPGPANADGLRDLPVMGEWADSWFATSMSSLGDLSSLIQRAMNGAFFFQVTELVERPLKSLDEIEEDARREYFTAKSDEQAREKGELFEAALLRLGKELIPDRVAELETEKATQLEERLAQWRDETQGELDDAIQGLTNYPNPKLRIHQSLQTRATELREELTKEEEKREELAEVLDQETEEKIESEAREVYSDVLDEAAEEAGFEITTLPSYSRQLATDDPRFEYRYSDDVKFLFRNLSVRDLEEGAITELLEDLTGRALFMVLCTSVDDITLDDITRRQFIQARTGFAFQPGFPGERLEDTFTQSFTLEALQARFKWKAAEEEVAATPK